MLGITMDSKDVDRRSRSSRPRT